MVVNSRPAQALHPEFGARVDDAMTRLQLKNEEVGIALGMKKGEMVRRYRAGLAMPKGKKMELLAMLLGTTPAELQWGTPKTPGVKTVPLVEVSPDEQVFIETYRQLPEVARKVLRARAAELLESFAPRSKSNPYGKGNQ
jgi:hypothetical protein